MAADGADAFADAGKAEAAAGTLGAEEIQGEALSFVGDDKLDHFAVAGDGDAGFVGVGVFGDVDQEFAKALHQDEACLHAHGLAIVNELDFGSVELLYVMGNPLDVAHEIGLARMGLDHLQHHCSHRAVGAFDEILGRRRQLGALLKIVSLA